MGNCCMYVLEVFRNVPLADDGLEVDSLAALVKEVDLKIKRKQKNKLCFNDAITRVISLKYLALKPHLHLSEVLTAREI